MDRICDYCRCQFDDSLDNCPHCGAPNDFVRRGTGVPTTIKELQQWYIDKKLPPEDVTRFFIGKNIKEPKAFGIYKNDITGDYTVYKNKANGDRAIRYQGRDESYAVNELYLKLKEEMQNQRGFNMNKQQHYYPKEFELEEQRAKRQKESDSFRKKFIIVVFIIVFSPFVLSILTHIAGLAYRNYDIRQNPEYRNEDGSLDWDTYYDDHGINDDWGFESSGNDNNSWDNDWDSDWDSNDSWDSGGTDWDSDW